MNITVSINKDFGELTTKKVDRITENFDDIRNIQNIDSQITLFQFDNHILVLNKPNDEIAISFGTLADSETAFKSLTKLLELLDLDNNGRNHILIEDIQEKTFSVAEASKKKMSLNDESDGVGLRFLLDTFSDLPKEIKIEPKIDDFNKIYISCIQVGNDTSKLTEEFINESITYLLDKAKEYQEFYLEKGGISG